MARSASRSWAPGRGQAGSPGRARWCRRVCSVFGARCASDRLIDCFRAVRAAAVEAHPALFCVRPGSQAQAGACAAAGAGQHPIHDPGRPRPVLQRARLRGHQGHPEVSRGRREGTCACCCGLAEQRREQCPASGHHLWSPCFVPAQRRRQLFQVQLGAATPHAAVGGAGPAAAPALGV